MNGLNFVHFVLLQLIRDEGRVVGGNDCCPDSWLVPDVWWCQSGMA
ncbi:MAG: hypothetical protein KDI15_06990 [Thiothrix sp.]|nr:hypothetical protein [Thiothrix sp.]